MILHVTSAKYISDYKIECCFNDGSHGIVDLEGDEIFKISSFKPLKNYENFKNFKVDYEINTIVWYNGADLAPEYLESKMVVSHK